jgi:hypothetical protein
MIVPNHVKWNTVTLFCNSCSYKWSHHCAIRVALVTSRHFRGSTTQSVRDHVNTMMPDVHKHIPLSRTIIAHSDTVNFSVFSVSHHPTIWDAISCTHSRYHWRWFYFGFIAFTVFFTFSLEYKLFKYIKVRENCIAQSVCYAYDTEILVSYSSHHIATQVRPQFKDLFWPHLTVSSKVFQIISGVIEY